MTAHATQTTGLTNDRVANWAPEVVFSSFLRTFLSSTDVPFLLLNQHYRWFSRYVIAAMLVDGKQKIAH